MYFVPGLLAALLVALPVSAQEAQVPTITVELKAPKAVPGILGVWIEPNTGVVKQIYPKSDALNWGIKPGDQILEIDHYAFSVTRHQQDAAGEAGTRCHLLLFRGVGTNRRFFSAEVLRKPLSTWR